MAPLTRPVFYHGLLSEAFRVLEEEEERLYSECRTRRLVLQAWHRLNVEGVIPKTSGVAAQGG